jgi:pSer/pThr/pTyr-binding forkhead associated (FHA) protein
MNFCKTCGASLTREVAPGIPALVDEPTQGSRVCERCQGTLDQDAQFCKYCGMSLGPVEFNPPEPVIADTRKTGPLGGAPSVPSGSARLVAILKDGSEGQTFPLGHETTEIGRKEGNILLPDDPYLSPRHARISVSAGRYFLKDLVSTNGVFLRIREKHHLHHGDVLLIGQQVLRFEVLEEAERGLGPASQHGTLVFGTPESGCIARLCQTTTEGIVRDVYHLRRPEIIIGREGPDIMFPDDPFMSRRHARITHDSSNRTFVLEDLGSFNGTSLRYNGERELKSGDQFRVGNHLFLFEMSGAEF